MGLFDFVKEYGKKLFGNEDDTTQKAESIKEAILEDNPGVKNLDVTVNEEGEVQLSGDADNVAAMEKAVLIAGNIQGVSNVKAEGVVVPQTPNEGMEEEVEYYTIEKGDTLWAIATKYYGKGTMYTKIVEDNLEVIKDADKIYPGQKIRIVKA